MAATTVTLVWRGTPAALYALLNHLPTDARQSAALQTRLGLALLNRIAEAFIVKARGGTDDAGLRWKPLAPYTIARRRGSPPHLILRDTGLLLNSLTPMARNASTSGNVKYQVFRQSIGEVIVGTSRPWAWAHHVGLPLRRPPLPQRRLWPEPSRWPSSWRRDLAEQAQEGVVDVMIQKLRNP